MQRVFMVLCVLGCSRNTTNEATEIVEDECIPLDQADPMPDTAAAYATLCEPHLGVTPAIDCGDGVPVPIYVDGVEVFEGPDTCDNPDFKGACPVGSRVGRKQGVTADGTALEDVVWVWFCRSQGPESLAFGMASVQMIGHNTQTGATCFFESPDVFGGTAHIDYLRFGDDGYLDGEFPGPEDSEFNNVFIPPPGQCTECHQNDAFIHTPWIDQARDPQDPSQPILPVVAGPDSPYWVVGGANWDRRTAHIEGNACVACHRTPDPTRILAYNGQDVNDFMPPSNPGSMTADHAAIAACYAAGPDQTQGCEWVSPPDPYCDEDEAQDDTGSQTTNTDDDTQTDEETVDSHKECPEDFDPKQPCEPEEKCLLDGTWYYCDNGVWDTF